MIGQRIRSLIDYDTILLINFCFESGWKALGEYDHTNI